MWFDGTVFTGSIDNPAVYQLNGTDPGNLNVIERIDWSYVGAPLVGLIEIVVSSGVIWSLDITDAGPDYADFGEDGIYGTRGDGIAVILHSSLLSTGKLHVKAK